MFKNLDYITILLYFILIVLGWVCICGATHELGDTDFLDWGMRSGKQVIWIGLACCVGLVLLLLDEEYYEMFAGLAYVFLLIVLFLTPFLAHDVKGSLSWIDLGVLRIQPAEFGKCITALTLAKVMGTHGFDVTKTRDFIRAAAVVLIPVLLIIMQKETGSALVYMAFFLMFYREGMSGSILVAVAAATAYFIVGLKFAEEPFPYTAASIGEVATLLLAWAITSGFCRAYLPRTPHARRIFFYGGGALIVAFAVSRWWVAFDVAWVLILVLLAATIYLLWHFLLDRSWRYLAIAGFAIGSMLTLYSAEYAMKNILGDHQRKRIEVLLGLTEDIHDAGYNVNQSKIAIGSGGWTGKGFMNGTQTKLKYVPEQDTDFIFCTVAEEHGFVGCAVVLLLYLLLIWRLIALAERQTRVFSRVFGYCVVSIFLFHLLVNVGMVMGLMPVIGIPLPFFSYGGSSLWGFTLLLFIFLNLDAHRKHTSF